MASPGAYLLVEGNNDRHVVWALCSRHDVPETFSVEIPSDEGSGVDALLVGLPVRLKAGDLQKIGVVVDADQDLAARWQSLRTRLNASGYQDVPEQPPAEGWISSRPDLPRLGVWLMPDNQVTGMLEDFVGQLIPTDDDLRPQAEAALDQLEKGGLNRYSLIHHSKAMIHTWLAWQLAPGMPMGMAITARVLSHDSPIALAFVAWLRQLFIDD